jgi:hypothetical protein
MEQDVYLCTTIKGKLTTAIFISVLGAVTSIAVAFIGAWFANRNSIVLQIRKLKEDHYIAYIEALHNLASENSNKAYAKSTSLPVINYF